MQKLQLCRRAQMCRGRSVRLSRTNNVPQVYVSSLAARSHIAGSLPLHTMMPAAAPPPPLGFPPKRP